MVAGSVDEDDEDGFSTRVDVWRWRSRHASCSEVWLKLGGGNLNARWWWYSCCSSSATSLAGSTAHGTITMAVPYSGDDVR